MPMQPDLNSPGMRERVDYAVHNVSSVTPAEDLRTIILNRVSLGAVGAGVAMALSAHLILNLLGIGIGAAANPVTATGLEGAEFSIGAMLWFTVTGIIAAYIGGLTAGRLAGEPKESTAGWHGLVSWSATVLLITVLMTTTAGTLVGGNFNVITDITKNSAVVSGNVPAGDPMAEMFSMLDSAGFETTGIMGDSATYSNIDKEEASKALIAASLLSVVALVLGAMAAWFGGCSGAVSPTITDRSLRMREQLH